MRAHKLDAAEVGEVLVVLEDFLLHAGVFIVDELAALTAYVSDRDAKRRISSGRIRCPTLWKTPTRRVPAWPSASAVRSAWAAATRAAIAPA